MPITLSVKSNYGGDKISQKYQPVETPVLAEDDKTDCLTLVNDRIDVLRDSGKLPRALDFHTKGMLDEILLAERNADARPPLLVISSNRSDWIAAGFARGADLLQDLGLAAFDDVTDRRALNGRMQNDPSGQPRADTRPVPAWYSPSRVNDTNRRVYIMVHVLEYRKYWLALHTVPNLYVIGWSFHNDAGWRLAGDYPYVGFGASRYAAIEFAKWLRRNSNNRWNHAWLVDDNVYYLNAFKGLLAAEGATLARHFIGMGFGSETATDTTDNILIKQRLGRYYGNPGGDYAASVFRQDRVLQQAVLWDIDWLDRQNLNFSPYFIASAEDTSITNYLGAHGHAFGITTEATILKQTSSYYDGDEGGHTLNGIRYNYERWYAITEGIKRVINQDAVAQPVSLRDLVVGSVFPVSQMADQAGNAQARNRAICQVTESIMAVAVKHPGFTPATLFQPNGNQQQVTNVM